MKIQDIMRANKNAGHFFFDKSSMEFFASVVYSEVYSMTSGIYFITSEKKCWEDATRVYSIRIFNPANGDVRSAVEDKFESKDEAKDYIVKNL